MYMYLILICLYCAIVGDMCEKETNRRKEEKEEIERKTRPISHSVEGFKIASIVIMKPLLTSS